MFHYKDVFLYSLNKEKEKCLLNYYKLGVIIQIKIHPSLNNHYKGQYLQHTCYTYNDNCLL